jgi:hypothetical protein
MVRDTVKALRMIDDDLSDRIAEQLPGGWEDFNSGRVEVKPSVQRTKWDHESLWAQVTARGRDERQVDKDTGEVLESEGEAVARTLRACVGQGPWKVTGLREIGLDPDEYCEKSYGAPKVIVS